MLGLPWWSWVLILIVAIFLVMRSALKGFRRRTRQEFIKVLKEMEPTMEVLEESEGQVVYRSQGIDQGKVFLGKLYAAIASLKPDTLDARREVYRHFFKSVTAHPAVIDQVLSLEKHGDRIMPRLVPASFFNEVPERAQLPNRPFGQTGLSVVYVIDSEDSVLFLTGEHTAELGLDSTALDELALRNLETTFPAAAVRSVIEKNTANTFKMMDSFDATRILLVPKHLQPGEEVVAVIPDRDTLFLAPVPQNGDWSGLKKLARVPSGTGYRLLDRPLKVGDENVEIV
jgi:hypothetical protein